jgi:hypothetical protein
VREDLWKESARLVGLGDWDPFTAQDTGKLPPDYRETEAKEEISSALFNTQL